MEMYAYICSSNAVAHLKYVRVSSICIDGAPNEKANESSVCELFRLVPLRGICMNVKVWSTYICEIHQEQISFIFIYTRVVWHHYRKQSFVSMEYIYSWCLRAIRMSLRLCLRELWLMWRWIWCGERLVEVRCWCRTVWNVYKH